MRFSASPDAEPEAVDSSEPSAELSSPPPHTAMLSSPAYEALTTQWLPNMQETLQRLMQERFRVLEQQFALEQQRQRNRMEEELQKVRQQLSTARREQQQQQQTALAAFRETIEQMRREFSAALQHLSEDVTHTLRQAEEQTRRALDSLRSEVLQLLLERHHDSIKRQLLGEYVPAADKPLSPHDEEYRQ